MNKVLIKSRLRFYMFIPIFLSLGSQNLFSQEILDYFSARVSLVYGPEIGNVLAPFPKVSLGIQSNTEINMYGGGSFGLGNALVNTWGSVSAFIGVNYNDVILEVLYNRYGTGYFSKYYVNYQLIPKFGLTFFEYFYFTIGPSIYLGIESNMIEEKTRYYPYIYPFLIINEVPINFEIGMKLMKTR